MYEEIKKGLIEALKKVKNIDVIFIYNEDVEEVSEYFYVVIKPISRKTESINLESASYLIDIMYDNKNLNDGSAIKMSEKIDEVFRPTLYFDTFSVLIDEANINVVDNMLHYTFSINSTYEVRKESKEDYMKKLEIAKEN
ncbi:MAG: hypothetical protein KGV43_02460 [Arcobacter sp.]|nr:hypothetical protein [Arcobacter sp.]